MLGPSHTNGVTAGAVRQYIKGNGIGCVGTLVRFRGSKRQVHAAHIQWVSFFDVEEVFCFYYNITEIAFLYQLNR